MTDPIGREPSPLDPHGIRRPPPLPPAAQTFDHGAEPPIASLAYASPVGQRRPGILTAIGVLSIVFGAGGILVNAMSTLTAVGMWIAFSSNATRTAWMTAMTPGSSTPQDRAVIAGALHARAPLSDAALATLDAFLDEYDSVIFPTLTRPLTQAAVSASINGAAAPQSLGENEYTLTNGRLYVGDEYVLWQSLGSSGAATLAETDVENVVQAVARVASAPASTEQYQAIRNVLRSPGQRLVDPTARTAVGQQIVGAVVRPGGPIVVYGSGGMLWIPGPASTTQPGSVQVNSQTVVVTTGGATVVSATTVPTTAPAGAPPFTLPTIGKTALTLTLFQSALSTCLAVYLLVIGILVFRLSRGARRHHLVYAAVKVALVVLGALSWTWVMTDLMRGFGGPIAAAWQTPFWYGATLLLPLVYPVTILIVMNIRIVRSYYQTLEV